MRVIRPMHRAIAWGAVFIVLGAWHATAALQRHAALRSLAAQLEEATSNESDNEASALSEAAPVSLATLTDAVSGFAAAGQTWNVEATEHGGAVSVTTVSFALRAKFQDVIALLQRTAALPAPARVERLSLRADSASADGALHMDLRLILVA